MGWFRTVLAVAAFWAFVVAIVVSLVVVAQVSVRAPAKAAASAAFWTCVFATMIMPRSTDNAAKPHKATRPLAKNGRMLPRQMVALVRFRMGFSLLCSIRFTRHHRGTLNLKRCR